MDPRWVTVPRSTTAAQWSGIYVTMNKDGAIVIGSTTHRRLGSPEAYIVHFEPYNKRLALEPAAIDAENAYPARVTGSRGAKVLRVRRLVTEFGIRPPDTIEFVGVRIENGNILVMDLTSIRISPKAHSQCRRGRTGGA